MSTLLSEGWIPLHSITRIHLPRHLYRHHPPRLKNVHHYDRDHQFHRFIYAQSVFRNDAAQEYAIECAFTPRTQVETHSIT